MGETDWNLNLEAKIIEEAKHDIDRFEPLYDRYYEEILRFVLRRTDDEPRARDLTSQTFLLALNNLSRYRNQGVPFSAWLYRIAANEVNKYYRKLKTRPVLSIDQEQLIESFEAENFSEIETRIDALSDFLQKLSQSEITILELRFFENKGFKEIAFTLNIKESAVKMRTYRALQKLREMYLRLER